MLHRYDINQSFYIVDLAKTFGCEILLNRNSRENSKFRESSWDNSDSKSLFNDKLSNNDKISVGKASRINKTENAALSNANMDSSQSNLLPFLNNTNLYI